MVGETQVVATACEIAAALGTKPAVAWARSKARLREIALAGFDEVFRAAVAAQREAFASGEPQAIMDAFLAKKSGG